MFSSSTTHKVHYTYTDLLSIANTRNYIQHTSDHFLFLESPVSATNVTNINEALTALSDNILTYFLNNPASINATIKYYVEPLIDLQETPPSSPKQNNQQTSSADNMLPVEEVPQQTMIQPPLEVPMNAQARAFIDTCKRTSSTTVQPLSPSTPTIILSALKTSGVPAPIVDTSTSNSTLFLYVNDPIFLSVRPFFLRISENARKRESSFNTQPTQCKLCMQSFTRIDLHTNHAENIMGCYNVARLRKYICLRKNIPLSTTNLPTELSHPTDVTLASYLMELN